MDVSGRYSDGDVDVRAKRGGKEEEERGGVSRTKGPQNWHKAVSRESAGER